MQMGNMQMGNMHMGNMQMGNMQVGNMQVGNRQMGNMQMGNYGSYWNMDGLNPPPIQEQHQQQRVQSVSGSFDQDMRGLCYNDARINEAGQLYPQAQKKNKIQVKQHITRVMGYSDKGTIELWQFILQLLLDKRYQKFIHWTGDGWEFKLNNPEEVARLWGVHKKKKVKMTYEKLS